MTPSRFWLTLLVCLALATTWALTGTTAHFAINLAATYAAVVAVVIVWARNRRLAGLRSFAVTLALLACIGLLEIPAAMRWMDYRLVFRTPILAPDDNPRYDFDEDLLFRRQPFGHFTGTMSGGDLSYVFDVPDPDLLEYDVQYDSRGFRNTEEFSAADVVVIGDSFVEGTYVPQDELISGVLASKLGQRVANLGVIAYGPQQELAVLRRYAMPLHPKTVVWVFFEGNDLKDALRYEQIHANPAPAIARKYSFVGRSFTKNAIQFASRLAGDPKPSALPRAAWVRDHRGHRVRIYFLYQGAELTPGSLRALEMTKEAVASAHQQVTAQGGRLVVAFAPDKYRVFKEFCEFDPGAEAASWVVNDLPERLRHAVRSIDPGIEFVDLTPPLQEAARKGLLPYARDDAHWSSLGHRIAAEAILPAIAGR
jgi:hypothetical protein